MGTYVHDLLRRYLTAHLAGAAPPHLRDRHVVGCDVQRGRVLKHLHRSAESAEEVQVLDWHVPIHDRRHECHGYGVFYTLELKYHTVCSNISIGDSLWKSLVTADCIESRFDDLKFLKDSSQHKQCSPSTSVGVICYGAQLWIGPVICFGRTVQTGSFSAPEGNY